jgi:hypothetical protein
MEPRTSAIEDKPGSRECCRPSGSYVPVNRYSELGLQWAGMEAYASVPLRQDRSMFSPAGRIGNGKRRSRHFTPGLSATPTLGYFRVASDSGGMDRLREVASRFWAVLAREPLGGQDRQRGA